MICTLTARRLKPGAYDDFRAAWDPGADADPAIFGRWNPIYHVRDVDDENVVISFGFFDGTVDELRDIQSAFDRGDQVDRIAPHVDEVLLDGAYEVVERIDTAAGRAG
jgi:hypothetical protein